MGIKTGSAKAEGKKAASGQKNEAVTVTEQVLSEACREAAAKFLPELRKRYKTDYLHWHNGGCLIFAEAIHMALAELGKKADVVWYPHDHYVVQMNGVCFDATGVLPQNQKERFEAYFIDSKWDEMHAKYGKIRVRKFDGKAYWYPLDPVDPASLRREYKRTVNLSRRIARAIVDEVMRRQRL